MGREDVSLDFTEVRKSSCRERRYVSASGRLGVRKKRSHTYYYSVRAHFEDEHPSPYFRSTVMREDVMRTENGVSRLTLHASLLTHCTLTHAERPPSRSESYG